MPRTRFAAALGGIILLAAAAPQDRRLEQHRKRLERALQEINPRYAAEAVEKLSGIGDEESARLLAQALGDAIYRIDGYRRSHHAHYDEYYDYLYGRKTPLGTDRNTVLEQIQDRLKDLQKLLGRMSEIRGSLRTGLERIPPASAYSALSRRLVDSKFWRERAEAAEILAGLDAEGRTETLRRALDSEPEPTVQVAILDALARSKSPDAELVKQVSDRVLSDYWSIRFAAIQALRAMGRPEGIDALVAALEKSEGRTRAEARDALRELTRGRAPRDDKQVAAWWAENRDKALRGEFDGPAPSGDAATQVLDFFTIPLHSNRVSFVIDASKSMLTSARWDPNVLLGSKSDRIKPSSMRKFAIAEFQLLRAFDSLPVGTLFAIVIFAEVQRTFELGPKTLDADAPKRIAEYLRSVEPDGETDLFAAVDQALVYACHRDGRIRKEGLDTIYLLSDGEPTIGLLRSMDPIVEEVAERNRFSKVAIHTIYVGRATLESQTGFMRRLAQRNHGVFVVATR
jgi:HEAT repeat protein